jgi:hypothetical protein
LPELPVLAPLLLERPVLEPCSVPVLVSVLVSVLVPPLSGALSEVWPRVHPPMSEANTKALINIAPLTFTIVMTVLPLTRAVPCKGGEGLSGPVLLPGGGLRVTR